MDDALIPLFAIFCIFGLPVLAFVIIRAMQHKERIEMIRHGVVPPVGSSWKELNRNAQAPPPSRVVPVDNDDSQRTLRKGITLAFIGLALTIGLSFVSYGRPGPWLLGGLIPMFIGLAQVLTAVLFGATFPSMQSRRYSVGPTPGPAPTPPPPPTFEGAYTYRPDPSTQELGRSSPPDRR